MFGFFLIAAAFLACEKDAPYNGEAQLEIDDAIIVKYMADSNVKAIKHSSGLYYHIVTAGAGNPVLDKDTIYGTYTMKILKDSVLLAKSVDSTFKYLLPGYIEGWKTGVSLIRPGGEIRLLVPSSLGYQQRAVATPKIPPNSILDITLKIVSVNKNPK